MDRGNRSDRGTCGLNKWRSCSDLWLELNKWRKYKRKEKEYSWNILKSAPLDIQECECIFGFWRDRKYFRVACEKGFMLVSTVHAYGVE